MEWQPIETAPKDGTKIIIFDPNTECSAGYHIVIAGFCKYYDEWEADLYDFDENGPTHWMPLPEPPK